MAKYDLTLKEGMKRAFYSDDADNQGNKNDLVVKGKVIYEKINERWTAKIIWDDIKDISRLTDQEKENLRIE